MAVASPRVLDPQASIYLEQYKVYLGDLGNIGSRYATVSGFYVSVISALLGILALAESTKVLGGPLQTSTLVVVCAFAICLCVVWSGIISFYRALFSAKLTVLQELESHLAHDCFKREFELMTQKQGLWLTEREQFVPLILMCFFVALIIIRLHG